MDKNSRLILVVDRGDLFQNDYFEGFRGESEINYESRILDRFSYIKRGIAENDPNHKQPIGYAMVINPTTKQVFAYRRAASDAKYQEKRLQGKWSWGVGGHIERSDSKSPNPIKESLVRELGEEVEINGSLELKVLGYINDEADEVGKVHFGILYIAETNSTIINLKDQEADIGEYKTIDELEKICSSDEFIVEGWSKISLGPLKDYLNNKNFGK